MTKIINDLTRSLLGIAPEENILDALNISDVSNNFERYVAEFNMAVALLNRTVEKEDKVAIQCALTRVRIASLNLSNAYQDIIDDVILINKHESWPKIPDDYQLSEKYSEFNK
ncbi:MULTISPECIES: hypothetical protein [Raoultella]|jgi:hypothetical protein|uniref:hypothetical protein n=1 Tax=Raoultella TaxID=160674 RepID=UPI002169BE4B|nr:MULTISPECIES: hypothetical protein [Raoultella]MCS4270618.1 hypothetical protein [Raoultella sp. BIGb0132]MCS4287578.1 hypothetical protein [Raoultella terrigena]